MFVISLHLVGCHAGAGVPGERLRLCLSYPNCVLFTLCCRRAVLLVFRSFSKRIVSYICLWEEVN